MKTQPTLPPDPDSKARGSGQTCKQPGLCWGHPRVSGSAAEEQPGLAEGQVEAGAGLSHRWKQLRADEAGISTARLSSLPLKAFLIIQ